MISISIIIVNYNTADMCIDAVNSVFEHTKDVKYEVIIVDNNSPDGSIEKLKASLPESVKIINSDTNLGFGRANNLGVESALGEYVFFLNPDTKLVNNAVQILYNYIKDKPNVGVVGGSLYSFEGKPSGSYHKQLPNLFFYSALPTLKRKICAKLKSFFIKELTAFDSRHNANKKPRKVGVISGADFMMNKKIFVSLGGFDKDIFMYSEEVELTRRIKKMGLISVWVPQAKILHYENGSFGKQSLDAYARCIAGTMVYIYKIKLNGKHVLRYRNQVIRRFKYILLFDFDSVRRNTYKKQIEIVKAEYEKWLKVFDLRDNKNMIN